MSAEQSPAQPVDGPLAQLERALIDEFVRERGYDPLRLGDLPDEERAKLLKDASVHASGKLVEVEARSHFLHELHDGVTGAPISDRARVSARAETTGRAPGVARTTDS